MSGIISYAAYVPYYRLSRGAIKGAWGKGAGKGERTVANFDEDSITMAAAAGMDCIRGFPLDEVDGLFFASTTSPYAENQCAAHLVWVLGLRQDVMTADFTNTLRAGTTALKAARDAVESGPAKQVLVVAADCRLGAPSSEQEAGFGDGAAALLIGNKGEAAALTGFYSLADQMQDVWRKSKDDFVIAGEGRWIIKEGFLKTTAEAVSGLLEKNELEPKEIDSACISAPDQRSLKALLKKLGLDGENQAVDLLLDNVGYTGTPHPLILLASALQKAKPKQKILVAGYGDGADALLLETTGEVEKQKDRRGVDYYVGSGKQLDSYEKYLTFRQLVDRGAQASFRGVSSLTMMWRDRKWVLGLFASKCNSCGQTIFPPQRVCYKCRAKDDFELVRMADKKAKVFTYSLDMLAGGMDPPVVQVVLEFDDKTRMYCAMTDRDPDEVEIGMEVEMTFRKLHEGAGFNNYFWKCRPVRGDD
jgi:3-hydroxy-3-methylglutaryl CoA synthase